MKRASTLIALLAAGLVAILSVLNWPTLTAPAPLDLVVAQVQAPLGVVMLGLSVVLVALFLVAYLSNQIGTLMESRKLLKEIQRVQELADKAEASRLDKLQQQMSTEFRQLNERFNKLAESSKLSPVASSGAGAPVVNLPEASAPMAGELRAVSAQR
jgi:uncharacterized integral membrane protein